jgi:putative SOS response-associated peptidase YedK
MCCRYHRTSNPDDITLPFKVSEDAGKAKNGYNIAPGNNILAIAFDKITGGFVWITPRWGFKAGTGKGIILPNARAETVNTKQSFKAAFCSKRCAIIADGFYEWNKSKTPFYFTLKSKHPFTMAGLYREDTGSLSCVIITVSPNTLMEKIHNRMPSLIRSDDITKWLSPDTENHSDLLALLKPYRTEDMNCVEMSKYVNSVKNEGEKCIMPVKPRQEDFLFNSD